MFSFALQGHFEDSFEGRGDDGRLSCFYLFVFAILCLSSDLDRMCRSLIFLVQRAIHADDAEGWSDCVGILRSSRGRGSIRVRTARSGNPCNNQQSRRLCSNGLVSILFYKGQSGICVVKF